MQGPPLTPSMAQMIKDNNDHQQNNGGSENNNSNNNSDDNSSSSSPSRGVSLAYGGGGNHGSTISSLSNNCKDRPIVCYCSPCLSCGRGEQGRATVRLIATLVFPLFLLSFFLMNDLGRTVMRNMRLRNAIKKNSLMSAGSISWLTRNSPIRRHEVTNAGIKREIIWIPLEHIEVKLDESSTGEVEAALHCPRGVLFLFHGCGRYAASFFYSPQGRKIVSMAYNAGLEIVAFTKKDEMGCWGWESDGVEVLTVGKKFMQRLAGVCGKDKLGNDIYPPVFAFGASSGGQFIAKLASQMNDDIVKHYAPFHFSAMNIQIMSPSDKLHWDIPTLFTVMDGDSRTKERVDEMVSKKFQGGPFKMITTSGKKSIQPNHFANIYTDDWQVSKKVSNDIYKDLVELGVVDSNNNMLVSNPRQLGDAVTSIWEKYDVKSRKADLPNADVQLFGVTRQLTHQLHKDELSDANSIWLIEQLNVAWDEHEITAESFEEVLSFFFDYGRER